MTNTENTSPLSMEEAVDLYRQIRDYIKAKQDALAEELKPLAQKRDQLAEYMLQQAIAQGVQSFDTPAGVAYVTEKYSATVRDAQAFFDFLNDNGQWGLADIKANKAAVKQYLQEHNALPPGVHYSSFQTMGVQKPKNKR